MTGQQSQQSPTSAYRKLIESGQISEDPAQVAAVEHLQQVYEQLIAAEQARKHWLEKIKKRLGTPLEPVKGLYFWGGVGRGKTMLMDLFFDNLPLRRKMRLHFHRFMHELHERLKQQAGQKNPLLVIADEIAEETRVICFDEFFVSDITDAMLLGGLFQALFARGVTLIATSNIPPHELYRNGLQRERFIPAIKLIKQYTTVLNVDGGTDYRLRTLQKAEVFHSPHDAAAEQRLTQAFETLATEVMDGSPVIEVESRPVQTFRCGEGVVWFEFAEICETPRSHADYIELSRCYHTVIVTRVPQLHSKDEAAARRFISLVDEFYERHVKLLMTCEVALEEIYQGQQLAFEFKRTLSRLQEMQSTEYLEREHLA